MLADEGGAALGAAVAIEGDGAGGERVGAEHGVFDLLPEVGLDEAGPLEQLAGGGDHRKGCAELGSQLEDLARGVLHRPLGDEGEEDVIRLGRPAVGEEGVSLELGVADAVVD